MPESSPDAPASSEAESARLFASPVQIRSAIGTGILVLLVLYTLYFARFIFIPVALALIFNLLLGPIVTRLQRWFIPRWLSALLILGSFAAIVVWGVYSLSGPAQFWINKAPEAFNSFNHQTESLQEQIQSMNESTKEIKKAASDLIGQASKQQVTINDTGLRQSIIVNLQWTVGILLMAFIMLFFMLCSRGFVFRRLLMLMPDARSRRNAVRIVRHLQADISRYLVTVTVINTLLGAAAAAALWWVGMSDPILWGVLVGVLNFAPYAGAAISLAVISLASFATFDNLGHILLAPAAVFALTVLEGNFLTPWVHGRRFQMSALIVFFALFFWGWLWGVAGMLMGVPLLVVCKVTFDHTQRLRPLGRALGR